MEAKDKNVQPEDLKTDLEKLVHYFRDFLDSVIDLVEDRDKHKRAASQDYCDVCAGGTLPPKLPCMCGGSGRMSTAVENMRAEWARALVEMDAKDRRIAELEDALGKHTKD